MSIDNENEINRTVVILFMLIETFKKNLHHCRYESGVIVGLFCEYDRHDGDVDSPDGVGDGVTDGEGSDAGDNAGQEVRGVVADGGRHPGHDVQDVVGVGVHHNVAGYHQAVQGGEHVAQTSTNNWQFLFLVLKQILVFFT